MVLPADVKLQDLLVRLVIFAAVLARCRGQGAAAEVCHADVLVGNLDSAALSPGQRAGLGAALAATVARENGMSAHDVMTLGRQRRSLDLIPGSQKVPWATIGWYSASQREGVKTMIASLIDECDTPQMMLHIFENTEVHTAVLESITRTLAPDSRAIVGDLKVLCTNVVRGTAADTKADALTAHHGKLFPPWETKDGVAACWGWAFIASALACPICMFRRCCPCSSGRKSSSGHSEFVDSDDGGESFSGH